MPGAPPWAYPDADFASGTAVPSQIDVAVIGGGITGLAVARAVAGAGGSVVLFESSRIGSGSSRHSLGVLSAHYPGGPGVVMERVGRGKATALWLAALQSMTDAATIIDGSPAEIVTTATRRRSRESLERDAMWLAERGIDASVDASGLRTSGVLVDPLELVLGLGDAVEKEDGTICEGVTVTSLSRHTTGYQVLSTAGKTTAAAVVVAAGARQSQRGVHAAEPFVIAADRYGALLQVDDAAGIQAEVVRAGSLTVRTLDDRRLMIAGHLGIPSGLSPEEGAGRLVDRFGTRFGGTAVTRVLRSWVASVGLTADRIPHVWRNDGIWFAGGFNGDAPIPAMAVGTELGEVLAGTRTQTIFAGVTPPRRTRRPGRLGASLERLLDR